MNGIFCPSVTPISLCSHHRIIMKISWVITNDQRCGPVQEVKVKGPQASKPFVFTVSWPTCNSQRLTNDDAHLTHKAWCCLRPLYSRAATFVPPLCTHKNVLGRPQWCAAGPPEALFWMSRLVTQAAKHERELARAHSQRLKQATLSLPGESVSRGFADGGTLEGYPSHYTSLQWRKVRSMQEVKVKGQGHRRQNPALPFLDRNSSTNLQMMMKWRTKLDVA